MRAKSILLGTLAIATLVACNNDENISAGADRQVAAFTASIDGQQPTRAYNQQWELNDKIGITGKSGETQYTNVAYETKGGDGNFTVVTSGTEIYYQDDAEVSFTAYYPQQTLAGGTTAITADTKAQKNQSTFDFLYATGTGSKASPNVPFLFKHQMAKVVLTILKGRGISYDEVKKAALTLQGFKNNGTFDILTGKAAATGEALASAWTFAGNAEATHNALLTVNDAKETVAYTLILFPQEFAAPLPFTATLTQTFSAGLDFTAANANVGDAPSGNYLKAGRQYNLSVTLHKTSLTVENCEIAPWTEATGGNVDTE